MMERFANFPRDPAILNLIYQAKKLLLRLSLFQQASKFATLL